MSRKMECVLASALMPACLLAMALPAPSARATVYVWEFAVDPDAEPSSMTEYVSNTNLDGYMGSGGYGSGAGLLGNGTAEFADTNNQNINGSGQGLSGNYGFVSSSNGVNGSAAPGTPIWTATDYTLDINVQVLENVTQSGGKSMAIRQSNGNTRGIKMNTDRVAILSSGEIASGNVTLTSYKILRFSVQGGATNTLTILLWDGVSAWTTLCSATMGGTGASSEVPAPGIAIGSMSGSGTQSGKFQIDYARIDDSAALGNTAPPIPPNAAPTCLQLVLPPETQQSLTAYPAGAAYPFASVDLGAPDLSDGLSTPYNAGDGVYQPASIGGRICHKNASSGTPYMYFAVDDARAYDGSISAVTIGVDYYDLGTALLILNYDSSDTGLSVEDRKYKGVGVVTLTNTLAWLHADVNLTDARFANSQNGASDFRLVLGGFDTLYLDTVTLTATGTHGPIVNYTFSNAGSTTFNNWTVSVVKCDGSAPDYTWLSVNPTGGTNLLGSTSAQVVATVDTTSLAPGPQKGYLKFDNDTCLVSACFTEPFTYSDGPLVPQGGWAYGTGSNPVFNVVGNQLKADGSISSDNQVTVKHAVTCTADDEIDIVCSVQRGSQNADPGHATEQFWRLRALDTNGSAALGLGFFVGSTTQVYAKSPGDLNQTTALQTIPVDNSPLLLEMKLHPACRTVEYWIGGVLQNTYPWDGVSQPLGSGSGVNGILAGVQFELAHVGVSGDDTVLFDNLSVTPLSNSIIRRIDLNVLGCSVKALDPSIRWIGPCTETPSQTTYTLQNNGAFPWTAFSASQVNTSRTWLGALTVSPPVSSGSPIPPGGLVTVTANVNWTGLSSPFGEGADINFAVTCDNATNDSVTPSAEGFNTINIPPTPNAEAFKVVYNGGVPPSDNNAAFDSKAGVGYKFELAAGAEQGTSNTSDAGAEDNAVYQLNDQAGQATLWRLVKNDGSPVLIGEHDGATIVARVKTTAMTLGSSIPQNICIYDDTISTAVFWGGTGFNLTEALRGTNTGVASDAVYHTIRLTSIKVPGYGTPGNNNIVSIYVDENPVPVATLAPTDDRTINPPNNGIGFGTSSGSATQTISFDWVAATNVGAFAPGEENSCIGALHGGNDCHVPAADADTDNDVDGDDFAILQNCYTGSGTFTLPQECICLDRDHDGDIDTADYNYFLGCVTGASVTWASSVPCPN